MQDNVQPESLAIEENITHGSPFGFRVGSIRVWDEWSLATARLGDGIYMWDFGTIPGAGWPNSGTGV